LAGKTGNLVKRNLALERNLVRSLELCVHTMQTFYTCPGPTRPGASPDFVNLLSKLSIFPLRTSGSLKAALYDIGLVGVPRQIIRRWQQSPADLSPAEKR